MKVYFTASVVGKRQNEANYQKILDVLVTKGIDVRSDHIMKATEESIRQNQGRALDVSQKT